MDGDGANRVAAIEQLFVPAGVLGSDDIASLERVWTQAGHVAVRCGEPLPDALLARLVSALDAPLAASSSPLPVHEGPLSPLNVEPNPVLADAPTITSADPRCAVLSGRARQLVPLRIGEPGLTWADALQRWCDDARAVGLRHVAAPGTALRAAADQRRDASSSSSDNALLEAHRSWTATRLRPVTLLLDGRCLPAEPATGTHLMILELAQHLKQVRPAAAVTLAVPRRAVRGLQAVLEPVGVQVLHFAKAHGSHDVVYRPYQMLDPSELDWLRASGNRWVFSQLDMIGFSNRIYHPDSTMADTVRNLQRAMMRHADGVTFISEFGRRTALAECPELDAERCVAIPIGATTVPDPTVRQLSTPVDHPYVLCLAADFRHKNRVHALRVFRELRERGYKGGLVLAGHHLFYGSSAQDEHALVESWPAPDREMVSWRGSVDERSKWNLLQHADAVIYPSVVEGFGLIPFEAAAVDTPCLAAAGSAFEELTRGTGVVVASSWDPKEWACLVEQWLHDPERRDAQTSAIRSTAATYSWDACAARTWDLLDRVVASPPRSAPLAGRHDGASTNAIEHLSLGLSGRGRIERMSRRLARAASSRTRAARESIKRR